MAAVLRPGRMTAPVPRTPTKVIAPHMEELAAAPRPGPQGLRHHTTQAPVSTPSPLDPALLAGTPVQTQAVALPAGTACLPAETSAISTMPLLLVETTPLPHPVHTLPRPLVHQLLADGPKVRPPLVALSVRRLPAALQHLRRLMHQPRRLVGWLLRLVLGMVVMTADHGTMIARVRSSCSVSLFKLQNIVLSTRTFKISNGLGPVFTYVFYLLNLLSCKTAYGVK